MRGSKGRGDEQMNKRTNESPPVFYRTSSPLGPLPKKRKFWLVDPPKTTRLTSANQQFDSFFLAGKDESRTAITTACYEVVKELVSPFYNAASLPTASLITLKNRAEALYKQHKGLIKDKGHDPPRMAFGKEL